MNTLDDIALITNLDPSNTLGSIGYLADQCESAWNEAHKVILPPDFSTIRSIVFTGMGGSAYGARLIKSLYGLQMNLPIELISDYNLPQYVNETTLVIAASYSGTTEETINCAKQAIAKNAKLIGISSGGPLYELLKSAKKPFFRFDPKFNPSGQPRIGQGYMQMGQLALLHALHLLPITNEDVTGTLSLLRENARLFAMDVLFESNKAKQTAFLIKDKILNLIAAEFLEGSVHAIRNPFHETGKHFANYFIVPELNHHLMEGLTFPESMKKDFLFLLIQSNLYSPVIQKRMKLTKEVIEKNNIETSEITLKGKTHISQAFELIQFGSFVTFYLAMVHGVNPAKIPWVDYFKSQLKN